MLPQPPVQPELAGQHSQSLSVPKLFVPKPSSAADPQRKPPQRFVPPLPTRSRAVLWNLKLVLASESSQQTESPRFPLCSGRSVVSRATSNTAPRNSEPPAPCSPGCKNCAPAVRGQCRHGPATRSSLPAAGAVRAQNFRPPRRAQMSSHRGTQNPRRDTPDEQGANSPSHLAAAGPDLGLHPQWSGLPRRPTIWSVAPIPVLPAQPPTLPALPPTHSRLPPMPPTIRRHPAPQST